MTPRPDPDQTGAGRHDEVGSAAEEALRLIGALNRWAGDHAPDLSGLTDHIATGDPECRWCPVCRVVHTVREVNPEARDHLLSAASSLLKAGSVVVESLREGPGGARRDGRVEHIDLDVDTGEDWEWEDQEWD